MAITMTSGKSFLTTFLTILVFSGFWQASTASGQSSFSISGYILDSNGRGIAGAMIIFGVPSIVPSVLSDSSGYYAISAPAGTYHLNVWPPFDTNYIYYDQPGFIVGCDIIRNITLAAGYKISGYILDTAGKPVPKAVVAIGNFLCGWYSNYSGYYFATAPAGTYTFSARPASGPKDAPNFPIYYEQNFVVSRDLSKNVIVNNTATTSANPSSFKISGYILDDQGRGIEGATVIFNVPTIVPSVVSDSSGHYVVSAPAGTYHVNVWPPYDSNIINYDEPGFSVKSDMTKNMTLHSGCKVSGYISDSSGTPIIGAAVLLDNFGSGRFSDSRGYYFVSVPAGTYTLDAHPRIGYNYSGPTTTFPTYYEHDFTVTSNIVKNITIGSTTPTPSSPTIIEETEPSLHIQLYSDDFSRDSEVWQYIGNAYRDTTNQYLVLTGPSYEQAGVVFLDTAVHGSFTAYFRYKAGGGNYQGDGFTMFFYKQKYSTMDRGGSLGFSSSSIVPGYGIEFDGWQNTAADFQKINGSQSNPAGDPSSAHIALIKDYVGDHLTYTNDQRVADDSWHEVSVDVQETTVRVFLDQELVLQWNGKLDTTFGGLGFSAGNGQVGSNWHIIDDFSITENIYVGTYEEPNGQTEATEETKSVLSQAAENSVFSVSSNSTITSLVFNSKNSELSFTVSGPSGTAGYARAAIAKSLVSNTENIKVYLDDNQLHYEIVSNADSWLLYFTYTHSTHQVRINLASSDTQAAGLGIEYWTVIVLAIAIVATGMSHQVCAEKRNSSKSRKSLSQLSQLNVRDLNGQEMPRLQKDFHDL